MSKERLKQSLEHRSFPINEDFNSMTPKEWIALASEMDMITQRNFKNIESHIDDNLSLLKKVCRKCESKNNLRPKQTDFLYAYFCQNHYPIEKIEVKKQRTLDDIFGAYP